MPTVILPLVSRAIFLCWTSLWCGDCDGCACSFPSNECLTHGQNKKGEYNCGCSCNGKGTRYTV